MAYDPFFFGFAEPRVVDFFAADFLDELFLTAAFRSADIFVRVFAALLFVVAGPFFAALFRAGFFSVSSASSVAAAFRAVFFFPRFGFSVCSR